MTILAGYLLPHPPVVIPAVGHKDALKAASTAGAMDRVSKQISELKPDVIIIISPHGPLFSDAISIRGEAVLEGNLAAFGAPEIQLKKNNGLRVVNKLIEMAEKNGLPAVNFDRKLAKRFDASNDLDHGVLVPLSFMAPYDFDYELVAMTYGLLSSDELYRFGRLISECVESLGLKAVMVASGDLSHRLKDSGPYRFDARGPEFDAWIMEAFKRGDLTAIVAADDELCEAAGECGKKSIDIMIGALDGLNVKSEVLSYEGPFGVGYGVVALTEPVQAENSQRYHEIVEKLTRHRDDLRAKEDDFVRLARTAIESFVEKRIKIKVPEYARLGLLGGPAKGAFVSIKSPGGLRGCIGSTSGTQSSLAAEIINNAIQAATEDPRFPEIEAWELENLLISVDVLSKGELVSTKESLDPKRYGVIVESGYKRGLLLPDLDGIETVEDQIRIALNKAGIREEDTYKIFRFTVERHV